MTQPIIELVRRSEMLDFNLQLACLKRAHQRVSRPGWGFVFIKRWLSYLVNANTTALCSSFTCSRIATWYSAEASRYQQADQSASVRAGGLTDKQASTETPLLSLLASLSHTTGNSCGLDLWSDLPSVFGADC